MITDIIATTGSKFYYTKNGHFISQDDLPSDINYLSINQEITFELVKNSVNNKEKGINVQISGDYINTGKIIYEYKDDSYIVKENINNNYFLIDKEKYPDFNLYDYIIFVSDNSIELSQTIDIDDLDTLELLNIEDESLTITYEIVNPSISITKKKGIVTKWLDQHGYGFVEESHTKDNIFIHYSNLPSDVTKLSVGSEIEFSKHKNTNGFQGKNIKILSEKNTLNENIDESDDAKITGTVHSWKSGFGFIKSSKFDNNIFVHVSALPNGLNRLESDQKVKFHVKINESNQTKKYSAINIELIENNSLLIEWNSSTNSGIIKINGELINVVKQD